MDTRYSNPGKILREWFPEQTVTQGSILFWTLVYLVNLVVVLLVQYHLVYTILPVEDSRDPRPLFQILEEKKRFDGYEFLDTRGTLDGILVLCRNAEGEQVVVTLKCHSFFHRYRLTAGERPVTVGEPVDIDGWLGNQYIEVTGDFFGDNGGTSLQLSNAYLLQPMLLTLLPFLVEILIFNRIRALLR